MGIKKQVHYHSGTWIHRNLILSQTFFYEKVGIYIYKQRQVYKSKYRPTFSILRVSD